MCKIGWFTWSTVKTFLRTPLSNSLDSSLNTIWIYLSALIVFTVKILSRWNVYKSYQQPHFSRHIAKLYGIDSPNKILEYILEHHMKTGVYIYKGFSKLKIVNERSTKFQTKVSCKFASVLLNIKIICEQQHVVCLQIALNSTIVNG